MFNYSAFQCFQYSTIKDMFSYWYALQCFVVCTLQKKKKTIFFKVSGCKRFILATFKYIFLKVSQLNLFI